MISLYDIGMGDLLIRNVSTGTLAALKDLARENERSVQAEALELIERAVAATAGNLLLKWAKTVRRSNIDLETAAKLLRESRDER